MKLQTISLVTLLTTVLSPFTFNLTTLSPAPAVFAQPVPPLPYEAQVCDIHTQSMLPTIQINDHVVINNSAYSSQSPKRGDIIVFKPTTSLHQNNLSTNLNGPFVKRVIGLPGETIKVVGGKVYINNQAYEEKYVKEKPNYLFPPVQIPDNSYFVLGDNRNDSDDSHIWGFLPRYLIIAQVVRVVKRPGQLGQLPVKSGSMKLSINRVCNLF